VEKSWPERIDEYAMASYLSRGDALREIVRQS
jgi:hypothetical protein